MAVSIIKTENAGRVREVVDLLGGMGRFVSGGDAVIVKPNICTAKDSDSGTVTDPEMVAEVCRMVVEAGGRPVVAESPIYPFGAARVFRKAGYADFESKHGFPLVDLDKAEARDVRIPAGRAIEHSIIPEAVLTCDVLINMPVMKTHLQTVVTLGLKNIKGVVVGKQKHIIHLAGLDQGIADLNTVVKSDLTIIDGIVGMEGVGGPTNGRAARIGVIVAGDNVVETDSAGTSIMGGDPRKVEHIALASRAGLGSMEGFEVLGETVESVGKELDLPRRPGLNRTLISGIMLKGMNLVRDPLMRLTGGERVQRSAALGELVIDRELCDACRLCLPACPVEALSFEGGLVCDRSECICCFCCAEACPVGALSKKM